MGSFTCTVTVRLWCGAALLQIHFPNVSVNALVIRLLVFGDDVEGVADVDVHEFVFGGVIDASSPAKRMPPFESF